MLPFLTHRKPNTIIMLQVSSKGELTAVKPEVAKTPEAPKAVNAPK